jgi:hypothetical protein
MTTRVINGVVYEFDPGTSPEVINRFVAKKSAEGQPAAAPVAAPQTRQAAQGPRPEAALPGYAGQALQGLSMGFSDEAIARLRSAMGGGEYEDLVKAEREGLRKFAEQHPVSSGIAEIGGAVLPAILTGGASAVPSVARAAPRTAALLSGSKPTIGRTTALGAGSGALSAVGTSEKPLAETFEDAMQGAGAGGATTLGLGLVTKYAAAPAFQALKRAMGFGNADRMADVSIAQALAKDGYTPDQAQAMLARINRNELTLADVGENTRALLRRATASPGAARLGAKGELAAREAGRVDRISDDMRQLMSGSKDFYTDVQQLMKKRSDEADVLYKQAWSSATQLTPQSNPGLVRLSNLPSFKKAMAKGLEQLQDEGLDPNNPANVLKGLHHTKRALDDMIGEATRAGRGNEASNLMRMKRELLQEMEKASPAYKTARETFAGDSEMLEAMNEGRNIYKMTEPEMRGFIARFKGNPSEYDAFRAGIAQAMLERARTAGAAADPYKTLFSRDAEAKIRRAFRDDAAFDEFKQRVLSESRMLETEKTGFRRSPADTDLEPRASGVGAARAFLSGAPVTGAIETVRAAMPTITGMPPRVATPTAQKLLTPTSQVDQVITGILGSLKQEEAALRRQSGLAGAAAVMAGQQAGERDIKPQYPGPDNPLSMPLGVAP